MRRSCLYVGRVRMEWIDIALFVSSMPLEGRRVHGLRTYFCPKCFLLFAFVTGCASLASFFNLVLSCWTYCTVFLFEWLPGRFLLFNFPRRSIGSYDVGYLGTAPVPSKLLEHIHIFTRVMAAWKFNLRCYNINIPSTLFTHLMV